MKHVRSLTAMLLALMLLLVPFAGALAEEEPAAPVWEQLPLGSSGYAIKAPAGYTDIGVTDEEFAFGMVSAFVNPDTGVDIDVFQYLPDADGFKAFTEKQVELFNGTDYTFDENYNGLAVAGYRTEWVLDGATYCNAAVLFDAGSYYVEIDFYWFSDNETGLDLIREMIATIAPVETQKIRLGSSPYFVTVASGYYDGEVTSEEAAKGLINYYLNDNLLFDFDVYENSVDESLSLEDVAAALCEADLGTDLQLNDFNGVPVYTFNGHDEYDGISYDTITAVLESGNDTIVAVVCWIDNEPMRYAAVNMLASIATEDELVPDEPMALRIGSSSYAITLPTTFVQGSVSDDEYEADGYAACYYSPYALFDIDFYQCRIADELPTLAEFTEKDAADYNGTEIALDEQINGVVVTSYHSDEVYNGINYHCATYTFAEGDYYYQLCFYWTDEDAAEDVEAVMETLAPVEMSTIALGRSPYTLTVPASVTFETFEDPDMDMIYTRYEAAPLKFVVYDLISNEQHFSLNEYAAAEAEYYGGESLTFIEINGVPAAYYYYTHVDDQGNRSAVLTLCIENGENGYIDVDFYIDDYVSMLQATAALNTLAPAQ